jgi:hypothetical protein
MARSAVRHNRASPRASSQAVATVAAAWARIIAQLGPASGMGIGPFIAHAAPSW